MCQNIFEVLHGRDFSEKYLKEAWEIDKKFYSASGIVSFERCLSWQNKNPDIYSGLVDKKSNRLVGYLNLIPINESYIPTVLASEFNDIHLNDEKIEVYKENHGYSTYLSSIAKSEYISNIYNRDDRTSLMKFLLRSKVEDLARKGIQIKTIWGKTTTSAGFNFALKSGATRVNDNCWVMYLC